VRTTYLSDVQFDVLALLAKRGHAMAQHNIQVDLRKRLLNQRTFQALSDYGYIRMTDQGWLATDAGRLRVQEGNARVV
jgi:hypothetical protein